MFFRTPDYVQLDVIHNLVESLVQGTYSSTSFESVTLHVGAVP
jgi:hypothetical protein